MASALRHPRPADGEQFRASSGRGVGAAALAGAAAVLLLALFDGEGGFGPRTGAAAVLVGAVAWTAMLRPRLRITGSHLVLHNMLEDVHLPLAAIEELVVRQVLAVRVGEKRFVSPVLGRTMRAVNRPGREGAREEGLPAGSRISYVDFVEERIRGRMEEARATAGVRRGSADQAALAAGVRRRPAWVPIGLLAVASALLLAALYL